MAMTDVTRILSAIEHGDPKAAEQLLPLVYDALRKLAAQRLAQEKPGQTLQATALVHEAYLRLVAGESAPVSWNSRGHFFGAAAEAMRRILVEDARRKKTEKRGGRRGASTSRGTRRSSRPTRTLSWTWTGCWPSLPARTPRPRRWPSSGSSRACPSRKRRRPCPRPGRAPTASGPTRGPGSTPGSAPGRAPPESRIS
jgi:hypothetical protein